MAVVVIIGCHAEFPYSHIARYDEFPYGFLVNTQTQFHWNDDKATANLAKHGMSFALATVLFLDPCRIEVETARVEVARIV
jgi:hypothetical protein